jgi:hypothetical protein|nr:MAG TPA: hypothetical protein [Caudoviricetes sp.]
MRLVDVEPFIKGWKKSGNGKKAEAKTLMNSGIYSEYDKGVALDCVADLVLALVEQLENAPSTAWTSVRDKQPKEDGIYLAVYDFLSWKNLIGKRKFVNGKWADNKKPVKFWMLIPKIPGDDE